MKNISAASVQRVSRRNVEVETSASDSDSAHSLFLTRSVTSASSRSSDTQECQPSKDEQKTAQHENPTATSDSDSETNFTDLLRRWRSPGRTRGRIGRKSRPRLRRLPKTMELPFLKKSGSGKLSTCENNMLVNSEIGGFFKCIQKLSKEHGENSRRELSPSLLPPDWTQNDLDESDDDDEDIQKVNMDCFIFGTRKKERQTWLPLAKQKERQNNRPCTKKSKKSQDRQVKMAKDPMEPQHSTDIHSESMKNSSSEEEPWARKRGENSGKSTRSSCYTSSTASRPSPDSKEKHVENQPQVLVQCSQSQSLDRHQTQKTDQARKTLMKRIDEMAVEETSSDQDDDKTQILENNPTDKSGENFGGGGSGGFLSSQDLFLEPDNQASPSKANEQIVDSYVVLNDIMKSKKGLFVLADDYVKHAKSQRTQPSEIISPAAGDIDHARKGKDKMTLGDISVAHVHPSILESRVVLYDIMKDKNVRCSLILADMGGDHAKYSKSQMTQSSKILPTAGDIDQEREEEDKNTPDDIGVEHVRPSRPLKDVLRVRLEEKMDSPLFNYGGMTFLKRKNSKKSAAPGSANNPPPIQADPDQNEGSAPHFTDPIMQKKSRNVKNDGLLENPTDTLPEICVPGEIIKDGTVSTASVSGIESKKKTKEDKNDGLFEEPVDTLPEMSVSADSVQSVQDILVFCPSVGENNSKKKTKEDKNDGLFEEPDDIMHKINVSADINLLVQDSLVDCASVGKSKPKKKSKKDKHGEPVSNGGRLTGEEEALQIPCQGPASILSITKETKQLTGNDYSSHDQPEAHEDLVQSDGLEPRKKKTKKRDLSPEMADAMMASQCSEEMSISAHSHPSVQDSSVNSVSGSKPKRNKDKHVRFLEEPVQEISVSADTVLPTEDFSADGASIGGSKQKKKRKKDKNAERLAEPVHILQEMSISADSASSVQDSLVDCASVGGSKSKKKSKKDRSAEPEEEEAIQIPHQGSASLVSITEATEQLIGNAVNQLDTNTQFYHVQSDGLEPQRKKKKKKKKMDSSPEMADAMVASQCSEESHLSPGIKTVKKKKQKFIDDVGEGQVEKMPTASKSLEEPSDKTLDMPEGLEIQPVNNVDLTTDDSVTPRKKKKKKRKVVREENVDAVQAQDVAQQAAEVVQEKKVKKQKKKKKKKKKKDRSDICHEEEADASVSLGLELGDTPTSKTPSSRSETGRSGEEEGLAESKSVKKKKKRKALESDEWSEYLDDSYWPNSLEMQLNDCERVKNNGSESSQHVRQSEDTIPLKRKKIVELDLFQENGSPSETSEVITKKKKKKKRKDTDEN